MLKTIDLHVTPFRTRPDTRSGIIEPDKAKMALLSRFNVSKRLGLMVGSAVLGIILIATVFLFSEKALILQERQNGIRQTVEIASNVLHHFHDEVAQGRLNEADGKRLALETIKSLRYGGGGYFWINDMHPRMVMHPVNRQLDGQDLSTVKDPDGKQLFVEFVDVVKARQSGFVHYQWPKPGSGEPAPKISYVTGFEPWGWVIGSGVYIDDIDSAVIRRGLDLSVGALVFVAVLTGVGFAIARSILRQLGGEPAYATAVTRQIADGDLSVPIDLDQADGASILDAIKAMRDGLTKIVVSMRQGAESLASASKEITQGNFDLSQRTEQQASALEQTAAAMEQLTSTVSTNADSAKQANQLAYSAAESAQRGSHIIGNVVETMQQISESANKISEIIGVVDGIAFQTNILALNAAIEAARAGAYGRSFAVVASEVRSLAGRSAEAAKEVKALINESSERVGRGAEEVSKARAAMNDVVTSIQCVSDLMEQISTASVEQSHGIAQVGEAVSHMDQVTQQNAALVEESAAAAASLSDQASQLVNAVAIFKVASD